MGISRGKATTSGLTRILVRVLMTTHLVDTWCITLLARLLPLPPTTHLRLVHGQALSGEIVFTKRAEASPPSTLPPQAPPVFLPVTVIDLLYGTTRSMTSVLQRGLKEGTALLLAIGTHSTSRQFIEVMEVRSTEGSGTVMSVLGSLCMSCSDGLRERLATSHGASERSTRNGA